MTPSESLKERTRIVRETDAEIVRILELGAREIAAILAAQPTDWQRWYLPQIMTEIDRVLRERGADAGRAVAASHAAIAAAGAGLVDGAVERAGLRSFAPRVDDAQLRAMREFLTTKVRGITLASADAINTQLGLVTIGAASPFEAIKAVQRVLDDGTRQRATVIVHTELARGYSAASFARLAAAADAIPGLRKLWRKSGKLHPRLEHAAIDGQTQPWDQPFLLHAGRVRMMYPHDPSAPPGETINCGCVMLPVVPKA